MSRFPKTPVDLFQLRHLRAMGLTLGQIAKEMGLGEGVIQRAIRENGMQKPNTQHEEKDDLERWRRAMNF